MKLVTAAQMQEIDRRTIEERGIPGSLLMERAGLAVAADICAHFESCDVLVLCGKGNNAGDGFVVARALAERGWQVALLLAGGPPSGKGDAAEAYGRVPPAVRRISWEDVQSSPGEFLAQFDLLVDALLGTGAKGKPRPPFDAIIEAVNASARPVVSIDIPSALDPDTGEGPHAVRAARTVPMGLPKLGMVSRDGPERCGSVRVEPLEFPPDLLAAPDSSRETMTRREAAALLPPRPVMGHKGTFGLLTIAAGSEFMPGAAVLCAIGAMRGGCGLVRLHVPPVIRSVVAGQVPEAIFSSARSTADGQFGPIGELAWHLVLERATAMALGPGMGTTESAREFLGEFFEFCKLPTVLDADALNMLAEDEVLRAKLTDRHVLTPHPGELARLLACPLAEVQEDRWGSAERAARKFGCTVVLKGAGTLVARPDGMVTHCGTGNTALARGGAGDVLTGLIGSLLAQGLEPEQAACLGVYTHGMASDIYTENLSSRGARLLDLAQYLPDAFRELEHEADAHAIAPEATS